MTVFIIAAPEQELQHAITALEQGNHSLASALAYSAALKLAQMAMAKQQAAQERFPRLLKIEKN